MEEEKKIKEKKIKEKKEKLTPTLTLFESSVSLWWKNLIKFILVGIWGFVYALIPLAIISLFVIIVAWQGDNASLPLEIVSLVVFLVGFLAIIYFMIRGYIGLFLLVKKNYEGKPLEIFKETGDSIVPYIGLTVLTSVFILLWALLLIIPGIIYSIFYSLAVYVFFFEDKRGMAAIRRSIELVKGYWWPVFGRYCFLMLVMWVFGLTISIPLSMFSEQGIYWHLWNGIIQLFNFLIGPIALLYSYQIYKDLVKIKK
jgi:hypothetical protein